MQFFVKNQFCVFPNCQTQYIIDNIHNLPEILIGSFTEDKADNIHCVKTSGTGKTAKQGGTGVMMTDIEIAQAAIH